MITRDDMIHELRMMLAPRVRTTAEVEWRTEVFRAAIALLQSLPNSFDANLSQAVNPDRPRGASR